MEGTAHLRVSDQDRDRAGQQLREHFAAGRLTEDEFNERVERRRHLQRRLYQEIPAAATPFVICTVIWVASGATGAFWPIFAAIPLILMLFRNGWSLYGPSPELDRVEQDLEDRHDPRRAAHHHRHRRW
jgi:hypothetical protein